MSHRNIAAGEKFFLEQSIEFYFIIFSIFSRFFGSIHQELWTNLYFGLSHSIRQISEQDRCDN